VEQDFVELYNNDATLAAALTTVQNTALTVQTMPLVNASTVPYQTSATKFHINQVLCVDTTNSVIIESMGGLDCDLAVRGPGGIATSGNLSGLITVTNGSASVTGTGTSFTTDFQVGDILVTAGGQNHVITSVTSNTSLTTSTTFTAESNVTYSRGGIAAGIFYYLYAIWNGSQASLIYSTRNVAGGDTLKDLPTGYTQYRQMRFAGKTNGSFNFYNLMITSDGLVLYTDFQAGVTPWNVLNSQTAIGWTTLSCSSIVPAVSREALFLLQTANVSGVGQGVVRMTGSAGNFPARNSLGGLQTDLTMLLPLDPSQNIDYQVTGGTSLGINVYGFKITSIL
jgi:hypothetical protein